MEDVSDPQLKRDRPSPYPHHPPSSLHHMPPAETSSLHNYHQPPPPGAQMPPQSHWNPTPSPYHESNEHRPITHDQPVHPQSYPPQHYHPPPAHTTESGYHRHGSISAPSRSPQNSQQPPYPTPPVNGNTHEHQYYQQPPPDYRARPSYGPPDGQTNGAQPPLHVTTNHEMMPGQPQSAPPLSHGHPYSAGPPPGTPYQWPNYDPYGAQRRKPVRAAQACDPCRSRKAKCDEGRPQCTHCKDNQLTCVYREVPPQKSEKQVLAITDKLESLSSNVDRMLERWQAQEDKINRLLAVQESQGKVINDLSSKMADDWQTRSQSVRTPRSTHMTKQEPRSEHSQPMLHQASSSSAPSIAETLKANNIETKVASSGSTTVAAADLLAWPVIKQLIPRDHTVSYIMDTETGRGLLRLYGCGEGEDRADSHDGVQSPATSSSSGRNEEDVPSYSLHGVWGAGQFPPASGNTTGIGREHPGGLAPGGGLNLDSNIVDKYYYSYLDNMHKLHPFLEVRTLRKMIHGFKTMYSWDFRPDHRAISNIGGKRKREGSGSPISIDEYSNPQPSQWVQPRNPGQLALIEHSIANAIILLVLALGKICAYKDPLPAPVTTLSVRSTAPHQVYSDLPMTASHSAPTSPYNIPSNTNGLSVTSGPNNPQGKNMDMIPGLAYFTKAADILGEMAGGVDVTHVQANLLAGLYMGQLARIVPSHWYIRNACNACQIIIQSTTYREKKISLARRNLINFAFWSCLQLESDILAEMEIPPSGIVAREASMWNETPAHQTLGDPEQGDQTRVVVEHRHYLYQIQLRRTLNDARKFIYNEDRLQSQPVRGLIDVLANNLDQWRKLIGDWEWDNDDHESADINVARMRGKYYGAQYIIHRPALYWALNTLAKDSSTPASRPSESPVAHGRLNDNKHSPALQQSFTSNTSSSRRLNEMRPPPMKSYEPLEPWILEASQNCVHAAIRSTTCFDKVPGRLIITNIFGTAHAQFGNVLVLAATHQSTHPQLRELVDDHTLRTLLKRTIEFLQKYEAISPSLGADARILQHVQNRIYPYVQPMSASSSFSSNR